METGELVRAAALSGVAAFGTLSKTAILEHRHWTHDSIAFKNPHLERLARVGGAHLADTKAWASVHNVHHSTPDVNLLPFLEVADYLNWHESQSLVRDGQIEIPDTIDGLDPAIGAIDLETVREIGESARELVADIYQPAVEYSKDEASRLMDDTSPRYFYEDAESMKQGRQKSLRYDANNPPGLQDIRFLLRDPHSPVLHRNGIPGVLLHNVPLYAYAERNFEDPIFRRTDLAPDSLDERLRGSGGKLRLGYVATMMLLGTAVNRKYSESRLDTLAHATLGAVASGTVVLKLIAGGNITNALGHGGDLEKLTLRDFMNGVVHVNENGTYTSNYKLLAPPTLDEVGGQFEHHENPSLIAYSNETGVKRWVYAPFGRSLEAMVNKGIIFKKGDNFGGIELSKRPDMPSDAVLKIEELRREHFAIAA